LVGHKVKYHNLGLNATGILKKFFSIGKLTALRSALITFLQKKNKQLHESWERFKELLQSCPHHEVPQWQLIQSFYSRFDEHNR